MLDIGPEMPVLIIRNKEAWPRFHRNLYKNNIMCRFTNWCIGFGKMLIYKSGVGLGYI